MKKELTKVEVNLQSPKSLMKFAGDLKNFIVKQNLYTPIQGKNYVNVEGWQFAGGNLGLLPVVESCDRIEQRQGEVIYRASVALYSGERIVSRGIAVCSSKEKGKNTKDEYVIASMAQTRAEGKAYRLILGWLMKVAGYEATPSEEVANGKEEKPKEEKIETKPETAVNYIDQVKKILVKKGAKDQKTALAILRSKTGLVWKNFNVSQVAAKRALSELLIK